MNYQRIFLVLVLWVSAFIMVKAQPSEGYVPKVAKKTDQTWALRMYAAGDLLSVNASDFRSNLGFSTGFEYEKFINKIFHIGIEVTPIHYRWNAFSKKTSFTFPDSVTHQRSKYSSNSAEFALYLRLLSGYQYYFPETYFDLGGGISIPYYYRYVHQDVSGSYKSKTQVSGIGQQSSYYAFARIGYRVVGASFTYRLTDVFKSSKDFLQPPVYTIGIYLQFPDFNSSY